jgi:hypothetical protein
MAVEHLPGGLTGRMKGKKPEESPMTIQLDG